MNGDAPVSIAQEDGHQVTYGFIGLGQMGWGMAMNLSKNMPKSSRLVVCELVESRRLRFIEEAEGQVEIAKTPKEVAQVSDVIITMLPKASHVLDAYTNPSTGLMSISRSRSSPIFFLDCSTIDVATSLEIGKRVMESNFGIFVDAPVSGGPNGANAGNLTIMVGGTMEAFETASPTIKMMGRKGRIFHCGPAGAGLATKQINNYLSSICTIGVCEAMNMGVKYGLDAKVLAGVINSSSGRCYNSLEQNPVKGVTPGAASENDFEGGFSVELCKGVLDMAIALGKQLGAASVLSEKVLEVYDRAVKDDRTMGKDSRSVYKLFVDSAL